MMKRITKVTVEVGGVDDEGAVLDIRQFVLGVDTQEVQMPVGEPRTMHRHVWQQVPLPLTNADVGLMQQILDIAQRYPFRPASMQALVQGQGAKP